MGMRIEFFGDEVGRGPDGKHTKFKAGQVVELNMASARHWLNRNKAKLIQGKASEPVKRGPGRPPKAEAEKAKAEAGPTQKAEGKPTAELQQAKTEEKPAAKK